MPSIKMTFGTRIGGSGTTGLHDASDQGLDKKHKKKVSVVPTIGMKGGLSAGRDFFFLCLTCCIQKKKRKHGHENEDEGGHVHSDHKKKKKRKKVGASTWRLSECG